MKWQLVLLGIMGGVQTADPTIASTALVEAGKTLHMGGQMQTIAASISTLMLAATVISTGLLADRIGRRRLLSLALITAIIGDLVVAIAPTAAIYLLGRAIAGIGLGAVFGASFAFIWVVVPAKKMPAAMGMFSAYCAVVLILTSFLGGVVASVNWRLAFLVVPVLCLLSLAAVAFLLPSTPPTSRGPADPWGQLFLALGIIGVLYGFSHASAGLASPLTWGPFLGGAAFLWAFVVWENHQAHPFFPMRLLTHPGFIAAICVGLAFNFAEAAAILQFSNMWQFVYDFSTVKVSLAQLPLTITSVVASIVIGRQLARGMAWSKAILFATVATTLGFASLVAVYWVHSIWAFVPALVLIGVGLSALVPFGSLVLRLAPPENFGAVTSSRATIGQIGYTAGISLSMFMVNGMTDGGVTRRLVAGGASPAQTGQGLDALRSFVQTGTRPTGSDGTALLTDATASYQHAFIITMALIGVLIAVLGLLAIRSYRRYEELQTKEQAGSQA